jgi:hypothetical protein
MLFFDIFRTMLSWRLSLLVFAVLAGNATARNEEHLAPCNAVAAHVKSVAVDLKFLERPQGQDYDDYDRLLVPIISFPPPKLADADLWAKAMKLIGGDQNTVVEIQHVAGSVWRASEVSGTAHCESEQFFFVQPDGGLKAIDTPAVFGDLCWSSYRQIGRIGGQVALIEQEIRKHPLLGVDVEITPWRNSERVTCQVAIRFNDAFQLTERFCDDQSVCLAAEPFAPKLAEAFARADNGATLASIAPPPPEQAQALATRLVKAQEKFDSPGAGFTELTTFGVAPRTKYPTYAGSPQVTLIELAGQTLIARVGIGGIGWRELGDYLITLYRGDGDRLDPIASFVVERRNTGLRSVTTSVPPLHGNDR